MYATKHDANSRCSVIFKGEFAELFILSLTSFNTVQYIFDLTKY